MKLTLGFSPCPNDTYIFDALVHQKIDTEGLDFEYFLADVEELNRKAFTTFPDIIKVSFHAFLYLAKSYLLLNSGAALGFGAGPLIVSKNLTSLDSLQGKKIAIPGKYTTANLLLSLAVNQLIERKEMLFSDIENAIINNEVDAGVIIHESRFTFQSRGLHKLIDLGEYWEQKTHLPVPLGGIVAHRRLSEDVLLKINRVLRRSIEYAHLHKNEPNEFITCNAQEMDDHVIKKHIGLYVNDYTLELGDVGVNAVVHLFEYAVKAGLIDKLPERMFVSGG